MTKTMREVLALHAIAWGRKDHPTKDHVDFIATCATCGPLAAASPAAHQAAHQAAALSAAGFGLVADAKREAWGRGMEWTALLLNGDELISTFHKDNPYRTEASS